MKRLSSTISSVLPFAFALTVASPSLAQDEPAAAPSASPNASAPKAPRAERGGLLSLGIERVGGLSLLRASGDGDASASLFTVGVGGPSLNPWAVPRLGVDYVLPSGLTIGGNVGVARFSASGSSGGESTDVGSVFLYALSPRVGYRIPLSDRVDVTPRAGVTLAGASVSPSSSDASASVFSLAASVDAPFAFRLTDSLHILAGPAFDLTLAASYSESRSTSSGGTTTSSADLSASLWSLQAWLGMGGYL